MQPIHIQKVLFLVGEELTGFTSDDYYPFYPHWFGPYSTRVAKDLDALAEQGFVESTLFYYDDDKGPSWQHAITPQAADAIKTAVAQLSKEARFFITEAVAWARSNTFTHICRSIYERYPNMAVNSRLDDPSPIKDLRMPTLASATAIMNFFEEE